ncbi:two-component system histidine kinase, partial [Amycolatopsis vancoresmycina DSM 44592]
MVVLLTVVCLLVGVVSEFALDLFLTRQIDQQLSAAANRSLVFASNTRPPDGGPPPQQQGAHPLGQNVGTVSATFSGQVLVHDDSIAEHGGRLYLTADQQALMLSVPADGKPHTMSFADLGEYRLMALPVAGTSDVVVTGLPMKPVTDTLLTVGLILFGVAAAGVLGVAFLGAFAVRRTLRPLDRVAATAGR